MYQPPHMCVRKNIYVPHRKKQTYQNPTAITKTKNQKDGKKNDLLSPPPPLLSPPLPARPKINKLTSHIRQNTQLDLLHHILLPPPPFARNHYRTDCGDKLETAEKCWKKLGEGKERQEGRAKVPDSHHYCTEGRTEG